MDRVMQYVAIHAQSKVSAVGQTSYIESIHCFTLQAQESKKYVYMYLIDTTYMYTTYVCNNF